jgi:hypothetical protein
MPMYPLLTVKSVSSCRDEIGRDGDLHEPPVVDRVDVLGGSTGSRSLMAPIFLPGRQLDFQPFGRRSQRIFIERRAGSVVF